MLGSLQQITVRKVATLAPRYLPFADVATKDVSLLRLLRLSLFQVTVGMALVMLVGTLNRVMIVELGVSAALVAIMLAMPLLFAPLRAWFGYKSDTHKSALGLRRAPYIWKGTLYQFGGFAIMPFALLVLSGYAEAADAPRWLGVGAAALSFLLVGAGMHMVQTTGLALATDLVKESDQPKVVGLMYAVLLIGMVLSALIYGTLLENYTPGRLIQVIQGSAVVTVALNLFALWKQEGRDRERAQIMASTPHQPFGDALKQLVRRPGMVRLLWVIGLGTFGFGMADILLEPYGGQVLGLSVAATTKLTALFASGTLLGVAAASRILANGQAPLALSRAGVLIGAPGFAAVIFSSAGGGLALYLAGVFAMGLGAGLFSHATLTGTIREAAKGQTGLALGAWGSVQATCAGVGVALAGIVRDVLVFSGEFSGLKASTPYNVVFGIEIVFLLAAALVAAPIGARLLRRRTKTLNAG